MWDCVIIDWGEIFVPSTAENPAIAGQLMWRPTHLFLLECPETDSYHVVTWEECIDAFSVDLFVDTLAKVDGSSSMTTRKSAAAVVQHLMDATGEIVGFETGQDLQSIYQYYVLADDLYLASTELQHRFMHAKSRVIKLLLETKPEHSYFQKLNPQNFTNPFAVPVQDELYQIWLNFKNTGDAISAKTVCLNVLGLRDSSNPNQPCVLTHWLPFNGPVQLGPRD